MEERKWEITYKDITIHGYRGSNWVYIGARPFISLRSAKIWIGKMQKSQSRYSRLK